MNSGPVKADEDIVFETPLGKSIAPDSNRTTQETVALALELLENGDGQYTHVTHTLLRKVGILNTRTEGLFEECILPGWVSSHIGFGNFGCYMEIDHSQNDGPDKNHDRVKLIPLTSFPNRPELEKLDYTVSLFSQLVGRRVPHFSLHGKPDSTSSTQGVTKSVESQVTSILPRIKAEMGIEVPGFYEKLLEYCACHEIHLK